MDSVVIDLKKYQQLVESAEALITYQPMTDEVDWQGLTSGDFYAEIYTIPQSPTTDPFVIAKELARTYQDKSVAVLVPGQKFDKFGNRQGRGGGWYDRFLSTIPSNWTTIGICKQNQFSDLKLTPKPWDVSMSCIFVSNEKNLVI